MLQLAFALSFAFTAGTLGLLAGRVEPKLIPHHHVATWCTRLLAPLQTGRVRHYITLSMIVISLVHMSEHIAQWVQLYVLNVPRTQAWGLLGSIKLPWLNGLALVQDEWMHWTLAYLMLLGLIALYPTMTSSINYGRYWIAALAIQTWHMTEHMLLLAQQLLGVHFFGQAVNTSIIQLILPRIELHFFYNVVVFVPMAAAMILYYRTRTPKFVAYQYDHASTRTIRTKDAHAG